MLGTTPNPFFSEHNGRRIRYSTITIAALAVVLPGTALAAKHPDPISGYGKHPSHAHMNPISGYQLNKQA